MQDSVGPSANILDPYIRESASSVKLKTRYTRAAKGTRCRFLDVSKAPMIR
jgi:hypothetical protein